MLYEVITALLGFTDMTLEVKGDKLVNTETGKVEVVIDNDRMVNKIMFKIIGGWWSKDKAKEQEREKVGRIL